MKSALDAEIGSVLEIVIDGLTSTAVAAAMRAGLAAMVKLGPEARRGAHRRRQLRRQARPAPLSSEGPAAMRPLVLTLRTGPDERLDLSALVPHRLAGRTAAEIGKIELQTGRQRITVGDIFRVRGGDARAHSHRGRHRSARPDRAGHGERRDRGRRRRRQPGRPIDDGRSPGHQRRRRAVGRFRHERRTDRNHRVRPATGSADRWRARPRGCAAACVVVRGDVGERVGDRLRRGTIIVEGQAGAHAGSRMIAGTLILRRCGGTASRLPHAPRHDRAGRRLR